MGGVPTTHYAGCALNPTSLPFARGLDPSSGGTWRRYSLQLIAGRSADSGWPGHSQTRPTCLACLEETSLPDDATVGVDHRHLAVVKCPHRALDLLEVTYHDPGQGVRVQRGGRCTHVLRR